MPPAPHRHSSFSDDSDRHSNGDPAFSDGVGRSPATSTHFPPPPRRNPHRIQVPRSTHREIESKRVRKVSDSLPGFSDWRSGSFGGGGSGRGDRLLGASNRSGSFGGGDGSGRDDDGNRSGSSPRSPSSSRKKPPSHHRSRRRGSRGGGGQPSSFHSGHSGVSSGHSSGAAPSSFHSGVSGHSGHSNIRDIESDVMARGVSPAPSTPRAPRPPRRHPSPDDGDGPADCDADASLPSVMTFATEETGRFDNTTTATMLKYKKLYETMLADAERRPGDAAWVGLGDIREEERGVRGRGGGKGGGKAHSFCGADDGNRDRGAPSVRRVPPGGGGRSFHSEVAPSAKQPSVLLDSVISGMQVEEILLEDRDGDAGAAERGRAQREDDDGSAGSAQSALVLMDDAGGGDLDMLEVDASRRRGDGQGDAGGDAPGDFGESALVLLPSEDDVEEAGASDVEEGGAARRAPSRGRDPRSEPSRTKKKRGERGDAPSGRMRRGGDLYEGARGDDDDGEGPARTSDEGAASADVKEIAAARRRNNASFGSDLAASFRLEPTRSKKRPGDAGGEDRSGGSAARRPGGRRGDDGPGGGGPGGGGRGATRTPEGRPEGRPEGGPPRREKPRAPHSRGRSRDRSRSPPSRAPSVGSHRSGRSGRSGSRSGGGRLGGFGVPRIISRSLSRGRSGSRTRRVAADDDDPDEAWNAAGGRPKGGFFRKVKKLAGKVKTSLGVTGVHKFRVGETVRYRVTKMPRRLEGYDEETRTVEAEILLVHIDAVLDTPYYTVRLPDGARKQTNWDKLIPLHEWDKMMAERDGQDYHEDPYPERSSRNRRERSRSRHGGRRRPYDQDDDDDRSARSGASHRSARSGASHRSERSERSGGSRRSSSRGPGPRDDRRRDRDRPSGRDRSRSKGRSSRPRPGEGPPSPAGGGGGRPGVAHRSSGRQMRY